jgi:DNA-binding FadR family transcriptional regulator
MGNKPVNAPNTNATQRREVNEQHQNVVESIMQRDLTMLSTTHQPHAMNVHHDDTHEPIQLFDEVVFA